MAGYVAVNRLSLLQLYEEERKQRAHLKKIAELQRRSRIDNRKPVHFPHIAHNFSDHAKEKNKEIIKENNAQSKRILNIMKSKSTQPPPPPAFRPTTNPNRRFQSLQLSQNNQEYLERIAKTKGIYDVREWQRGFEEHKEHLKISKDNKLFTPRDIGINRQRVKAASLIISRRTTPTSSIISMGGHQLNNTH